MTKEITREDSGTEYIQFRGAQSSVTVDGYPVKFGTDRTTVGDREIQTHEAYPIAGPDGALTEEEATESDEVAVWHEMAATLVETNTLLAYGVACELCEDVFDTPRGLSSHMRTHTDGNDENETEQEQTADESGDE